MKTCAHCKINKPKEKFNKSKKAKDGLQSWCKECKRKSKNNLKKEKSNQFCKCGCGEFTFLAPQTDQKKGWKKGKPLQYLKGHYKEGSKIEFHQRPKAQQNGYKVCSKCENEKSVDFFNKDNNNPDGYSYYCQNCQRKRWHKIKNKYKGRKLSSQQMRVKKFKRRSAEVSAKGYCDEQSIQYRIEFYKMKCWMCGDKYEEVDHVIPLNKGGTNWASNLRPICKSCNSAKSDRWLGVGKLWLLIKRYAKK